MYHLLFILNKYISYVGPEDYDSVQERSDICLNEGLLTRLKTGSVVVLETLGECKVREKLNSD